MASISTATGPFSGINTADIIDKLIAVDAGPRDAAKQRITDNTAVKTALLGLSAKILGLQGTLSAFRSTSVLNSRSTSVSNPSVLAVTASSSAALGSTQFRAVQQAQSQRVITAGFADADTPIGAGTLTIKQGGFLNVDTSLSNLNGGAGVPLGKVRITNRSGAQTVVDLSAARTVGDVINQINNTAGVGVVASTDGDRLVLADATGQTTTNISVSEINSGTTAAALGLTTGTFSSTKLTGSDVVKLTTNTNLALLNDRLGVQNATGDDFRITARDGSTIDIDISSATSVQGVLDAINNDSQNGGKVVASIDPAGEGLRLTDATGGGGTLSVSAMSGSTAAKDLGILGNEQAGGVLTGQRLQASLNSVLLRNLNGGSGVTTLGTVQLTDRSGANATIDLSAASSLSDVVSAINQSGLGIQARLNSANNGISLTDTTGSTASNLIIADGTGTVAADLHLTTNAAVTSVNTGDLNLRYINENTRLSQLNGGAGVQFGTFKITDSSGKVTSVVLSSTTNKTVGDAIRTINSSGAGVLASINSTGDGILLTDTAGGGAQLTVQENGGRTAADLNLLGAASGIQIDGAYRTSVTVTSSDTLNTLITKLTDASNPFVASLTNDGSTINPSRLVIDSIHSGAAGRLLIDTGTTGLNFSTIAEGADALLQIGSSNGSGTPLLFSSSTNKFSQILNGLDVTLQGVSDTPVTVTIGEDSSALTTAVNTFINSFNSVSNTIDSATSYDTTTQTANTLFSDSLTLQIESALFRTVQQSYGSGSISRLTDLGISVRNGQLQLDQTKLSNALSNDPNGVKNFLKTASTGFADRAEQQFKAYTDSFSGQIAQRVQFLDEDSDDFQKRYDQLNASLEVKRTLLEVKFAAMENAYATLQTQQTALNQLASITLSSSSTSKK